MKDIILNSFNEAQKSLHRFVSDPANAEVIEQAAQLITAALECGKKVIACGNGGSLCDATHFAEEMTARFRGNRTPLPALAINDPGHITCVGNDFGYEEIFSKYVEALGNQGDVLIAFSTSGNSKNILRAAEEAHSKGMSVIGMTRTGTNKLAETADLVIQVPHQGYADRIQEIHILVVHILLECIEAKLGLAIHPSTT